MRRAEQAMIFPFEVAPKRELFTPPKQLRSGPPDGAFRRIWLVKTLSP